MSTGYKIVDQEALHYATFQVVNWVDLFTRQVYRDIVIDSFKYCQTNKELNEHIRKDGVSLLANKKKMSGKGHLFYIIGCKSLGIIFSN